MRWEHRSVEADLSERNWLLGSAIAVLGLDAWDDLNF